MDDLLDRSPQRAQHLQVGHGSLPGRVVAQALLEHWQIRVYDELPEGKRVLNMAETVAAQAKAAELAARFVEWVWENTSRAADLARTYKRSLQLDRPAQLRRRAAVPARGGPGARARLLH